MHAADVAESSMLDRVPPGVTVHDVYMPDLRSPTEVTFILQSAGSRQDERTLNWRPQKHWEIHMVHFSHHDMGYSDMPANLFVEHAAFMDRVLDYCEETADWPEESKFRYLAEQA